MRGVLNGAVRHLKAAMAGKSFRRWKEAAAELRGMRKALASAANFLFKVRRCRWTLSNPR
jgi:hypothetical protein